MDENSIQLGPGGGSKQFSMWSRGSYGGAQPSQESDRPAAPANRCVLYKSHIRNIIRKKCALNSLGKEKPMNFCVSACILLCPTSCVSFHHCHPTNPPKFVLPSLYDFAINLSFSENLYTSNTVCCAIFPLILSFQIVMTIFFLMPCCKVKT